MADRQTLTKTTAPGAIASAGVAVTMTATDVANKDRFISTGKELVIAQNTGVGACTVTITSAADEYGRLGHITAESIAASAIRVYGPFPVAGWRQSTGYVHLEASAVDVKFGVVTLP